MQIRPTEARDITALQDIIAQTELFPETLLPEMIGDFLGENEENAIWLTCEANGTPTGLCYAAPEAFTDGTWNMRAIAVLPEQQGSGHGATLVTSLERIIANQGGRIVLVDTSGTDAFEGTRRFYERIGYTKEARIRDYWTEGDDKIVFWKSVNA